MNTNGAYAPHLWCSCSAPYVRSMNIITDDEEFNLQISFNDIN